MLKNTARGLYAQSVGIMGIMGRVGTMGKREYYIIAWQCRVQDVDNANYRITYYLQYPIIPIVPKQRTT
ncbi:MAG: hypothetical protein IIU78_03925 [Alistipes sp.]|nr:hypothetical protein [Alistipes sp.]